MTSPSEPQMRHPSSRTIYQWFNARIFSFFALASAATGCTGPVPTKSGTGGTNGSSSGGSVSDAGGAAGRAAGGGGLDGMSADGASTDGILIKQIAAGGSYTCALLSNGTVKCWGYNPCGQIGEPSATALWSVSAVEVNDLLDALEVSVGDRFACAALRNGTIECWGCNEYGQLGDGTTSGSAIPVAAQGLSNAVQVVADDSTACARLHDGTVTCWGAVAVRFGDGGTATPGGLTRVAMQGLAGTVQLAGYGFDSCALNSDGTEECWGSNDHGQLGDGTMMDSPTPVAVQGLTGVVQIARVSSSSCALLHDGTVRCWGANTYGELGNGTTNDSLTPVSVQGISTAVQVSTGACAILADETVRCWGGNWAGQLGNGDNSKTNSSTPVVVTGLSGVSQISHGGSHTCALLSDGTARCWGDNSYGELGDGTRNSSSLPVTVTVVP